MSAPSAITALATSASFEDPVLQSVYRCLAWLAAGDTEALEAFCRQQVLSAGLTPVGHLFHGFEEGGGVTGVVVLAESHLSVHTWPETGYVTLDVYVCNYSADNRAKAQALFDGIVAAFGPHKQTVHCIERG